MCCSGYQIQSTKPDIQLRWRNRTLLNSDTEEDGNHGKNHHSRYENRCKNLAVADSRHSFLSVVLKMRHWRHADLLLSDSERLVAAFSSCAHRAWAQGKYTTPGLPVGSVCATISATTRDTPAS